MPIAAGKGIILKLLLCVFNQNCKLDKSIQGSTKDVGGSPSAPALGGGRASAAQSRPTGALLPYVTDPAPSWNQETKFPLPKEILFFTKLKCKT